MTIAAEALVVRDPEPIVTNLDNEVVMLSVRAQAYFGLGEVGSAIWNMLDRPRRMAEICDALVERYDVERTTLEQDVNGFLTELLGQRLIRLAEADERPK